MNFKTYQTAMEELNLVTLEERRRILCEKFSNKAAKHPNHKNWFKPNPRTTLTRQEVVKYCPVVARTRRFEKSAISYLTNLLNK